MTFQNWLNAEGRFSVGIHKPSFIASNQRESDFFSVLGKIENGRQVENKVNFPPADVEVQNTSCIFEIPNPFTFRGTTYIKKDWADRCAADPSIIKLPPPPNVSLSTSLSKISGTDDPKFIDGAFQDMPGPILLAAATTSSDPNDLVRLARISCSFVDDEKGRPTGLIYEKDEYDLVRPLIRDHALFEAVANNPSLPEPYKIAMVLRPGAQGGSEIIGEARSADSKSHVLEYLRRNSYIAWGHYASNMADDCVRYSAAELTETDMRSLRRLYYQRTYLRMAEQLGLGRPSPRKTLTDEELESLRDEVTGLLKENPKKNLQFNATLWGWNYGFDFAPSGYRLHASHQQIHQQFAMIPAKIASKEGGVHSPYGCGDLVADCAERFREKTGRDFFFSYLSAIRNNTRTDGRNKGPTSLVVHQDENVMLFVPKAQTSQWELQLVCLKKIGNIVEADFKTRQSLDRAILIAIKTFEAMGARMVTTIEFPKRIDSADRDQRLLYSFLPRLPESPGAFSEAQLRWINGHYPEDFAESCRQALNRISCNGNI